MTITFSYATSYDKIRRNTPGTTERNKYGKPIKAPPSNIYLTITRWFGWLGWAMVLGSFQCRGVLLRWHILGQGPAVLAAGAGRRGYIFIFYFFFFFFFFSSRLLYLPFLMPHLLGDGWTF